jgi:hypothetical protein
MDMHRIVGVAAKADDADFNAEKSRGKSQYFPSLASLFALKQGRQTLYQAILL